MSVSLPFSFHAIPIHPFLHQTLNASPVDVQYWWRTTKTVILRLNYISKHNYK